VGVGTVQIRSTVCSKETTLFSESRCEDPESHLKDVCMDMSGTQYDYVIYA
jgi:hypothetical protein